MLEAAAKIEAVNVPRIDAYTLHSGTGGSALSNSQSVQLDQIRLSQMLGPGAKVMPDGTITIETTPPMESSLMFNPTSGKITVNSLPLSAAISFSNESRIDFDQTTGKAMITNCSLSPSDLLTGKLTIVSRDVERGIDLDKEKKPKRGDARA
jgi:hypothetical protein